MERLGLIAFIPPVVQAVPGAVFPMFWLTPLPHWLHVPSGLHVMAPSTQAPLVEGCLGGEGAVDGAGAADGAGAG